MNDLDKNRNELYKEQPLNLLGKYVNPFDTQSSLFRNGITLEESVPQLKMARRHGRQLLYSCYSRSHLYGSRRLSDAGPAQAWTSPDAILTAARHTLHAHDASLCRLRARACESPLVGGLRDGHGDRRVGHPVRTGNGVGRA